MNTIIDTKFFRLFSSLDATSQADFKNFLEIQGFNTSSKINQFIQIFYKQPFVVNKESLYTQLFPEDNYQDSKLRNLLSRTYNALLNFLSVKETLANPLQQMYTASKATKTIDDDKLYIDNLNRWGKELFRNQSEEKALYKMLYYEAKHEHDLLELSSVNRLKEINSSDYNLSLDHYFILSKLRLFINSINHKNVAGIQEDLTFYDEVIKYVQINPSAPSVIQIHYAILICYTDSDNEKNYQKLKSLLARHANEFSAQSLRSFYLHAQNYCIRQFNAGKANFLKELVSIYEIMIENKTILDNGILSQWSYKNIVTIGLRANKTNWVNEFIQSHKAFIPNKQQEAAYSFNMANYSFYMKNYEKAIPLLQEVDYTDLFYILGSKVMLLKIYYELDEYDSLVSLLESFTKFLQRRKKLTQNHKQNHLNFIKYLKKILSTNLKDYESLKAQISQTKNVSDRAWLLRKIDEL